MAPATGSPYDRTDVMHAGGAIQLLMVRTSAVAAEALETLLEERGALGSAIERRRGARLVRLLSYFPAGSEVPVVWVREKLAALHAYGVPVGPAEVRLMPLREEDWSESWKRHFRPCQVTPRLWIVPTWEDAPAGAMEVVRLDPGMAFGQGDHPTTRGCLVMMERMASIEGEAMHAVRSRARGVSCDGREASPPTADVGTGTGILAIRAVQLGLGPVEAFDTEADAIRAARENAALNGMDGQIRFKQGTLPARGETRYRCILANIFFSVLMDLLPRFDRALAPGGELIAAGILGEQEERFRAAAEARGLRVIDRICERAQRGARRWPVLWLRKDVSGRDSAGRRGGSRGTGLAHPQSRGSGRGSPSG